MAVPPPELVEVALAVVVREGRVLVARREAGLHLEGLWEFPGGKIEPGEEPARAAVRELGEETGLTGEGAEPLTVFHHAYPDRNLKLHVFVVRAAAGNPGLEGGRAWSWVDPAELNALPMPPANRAILRALRWRLGR